MEFFAYIKNNLKVESLQQQLIIKNLSNYCASIDSVLKDEGDCGVIYCIWGEFAVTRECINGGVRFSLPTCPNNIAWSITEGHEPYNQQTVVHLTMNRETHEAEFIDSINIFVADWKKGLSL